MKTVEDVKDEFSTSDEGLSEDEVQERREKYGRNTIETEDDTSFASLFLDHATEFVSLLLIGVGSVALLTYFLSHEG
ncbi:MAG: cation-transporting P-type ATPase, partial [Candidatus Nanohalobium sp.]